VSVSAVGMRLESPFLASARNGDSDAFQHLAEPYRRELQLHCYRMLGSVQDAEDLVQQTLVRAWRNLNTFEGCSSFRSWVYRIATNACLNALASRATARRLLPQALGSPAGAPPDGRAVPDLPWLEPYPDAALEGVPDAARGPEARYQLHEAVQLAFVAAIQHLPPRQRAVLLLRDVLGWSASDTARLLESSVVSANSALQRARATLHRQFPGGRPATKRQPDDEQRALVERYTQMWEGAEWRAHTIQVLTIQDTDIAVLTTFRDTRLFTAFGLPAILPSMAEL
jgi:RNA polymerase sigma-70 factor (ECF subfamily)